MVRLRLRFFLSQLMVCTRYRIQCKCSHYTIATTSQSNTQPIESKHKSQSQIVQCELAFLDLVHSGLIKANFDIPDGRAAILERETHKKTCSFGWAAFPLPEGGTVTIHHECKKCVCVVTGDEAKLVSFFHNTIEA